MKSNALLLIFSAVFLIAAGVGVYYGFPTGNPNALTLSAVVLVGFASIVVLTATLVIVYQVLGLADLKQALALPEGSVRALIAFSLVLVFVCVAAFLYSSVSSGELIPSTKPLTKITEAQLAELKAQFVVAYEPARKANGSLETDADGKSPLYNAAYFTKRSKDADDFAKQIFTTLATIFVSVISFYFGSSATASGVGVGAKAARDGSDGGQKGDPQSALAAAKASAHDAQSAADRATTAAKSAAELVDKAPDDKKAAAQDNAKKAQEQSGLATQAAKDASQQVEAAGKAVADTTAAGTDATKASTAAADAVKARDAAKVLAEKAEQSANEAERLLKQIKNDTGAV